jgi:hypothetical protein
LSELTTNSTNNIFSQKANKMNKNEKYKNKMKRAISIQFIICILILLCDSFFLYNFVHATEIVQIEYFFDKDPGFGNATPVTVTPDQQITVTTNANLSNLPTGLHRLYVRAKDSNGNWGVIQHQSLLIQKPSIPDSTEVETIPIKQAEIFFDNDAGFGQNTIFLSYDSDQSVGTIDISNLETGLHRMYVRMQDENGDWGVTQHQSLLIQKPSIPDSTEIETIPIKQAEIFFDNDTGFGQNTIFLTYDTDQSSGTIDISNLESGLHRMYVRMQDENGNWGVTQHQSLLIQKPVSHDGSELKIVNIEYFFDGEDPGKDFAIPIFVRPGNIVSVNETLSVNNLNQGEHSIYARTKSSNGQWSEIKSDSFTLKSECSVVIGGAVYNIIEKSYVSNISMKLMQNDILIKDCVTNARGRYAFCMNGIQNNTYEIKPDSENNQYVFSPSRRIVNYKTSYSGYHFQVEPKATELNFSLEFITPSAQDTLKENHSFLVSFDILNLPENTVVQSAKLVSVRSSDKQQVNSSVYLKNNRGSAEMLLKAGAYDLIATVKVGGSGKTLEKTIEKQLDVKKSSEQKIIDSSQMLACNLSGKDLSYSIDETIYPGYTDNMQCQLNLDNEFSIIPETIQIVFYGENGEQMPIDLLPVDKTNNYQSEVAFTDNYNSRIWSLSWRFSTEETLAHGNFLNSIMPRDKAIQVSLSPEPGEISWNPYNWRQEKITFKATVLDQNNNPIKQGLFVKFLPDSEVFNLMGPGNVKTELISPSEGIYELTVQPVAAIKILDYDQFKASLYFQKQGFIPAESQAFTIFIKPFVISEFEVIDQFINNVRNTNKVMFNTIDSQLIPMVGELSHLLKENNFSISPDGYIGLTFKVLNMASTCVGNSKKLNKHSIKLAKNLVDKTIGNIGKIETGLAVMKAIDRTFSSGFDHDAGNWDSFINKVLEPEANKILDNAISELKENLYKISAANSNFTFTQGQKLAIEECLQRLSVIRTTLIWEVNWLNNQIMFGLLDESLLSLYALAPDAVNYLAGLIAKVPGGQPYGCVTAGAGLVVSEFVEQFQEHQEKKLYYLYELANVYLRIKTVEIFNEMTNLLEEVNTIILDTNASSRLTGIQIIPEKTQAKYDEGLFWDTLTNVQTPIKAVNSSNEKVFVSLDMCRFHAVKPKKMFDLLGYEVNNYLVFNDQVNILEGAYLFLDKLEIYDQDLFWVTHYATQDYFNRVPPQLINIELKEKNGKKYINAVMDFAVTFSDGLKLSYPETFNINFTEEQTKKRRTLLNNDSKSESLININSELRRMGNQTILLHRLTNRRAYPVSIEWVQPFPQGIQLIGDENMALSGNSLTSMTVLSFQETQLIEMIVAPGSYTGNVTIPSLSIRFDDDYVSQSRPLIIPDEWLTPLLISINTPDILYAETWDNITVNISNSSSEIQFLNVSVSAFSESMAISETKTLNIAPFDQNNTIFSFRINDAQVDSEIFHVQIYRVSDETVLLQRDIRIEIIKDIDQDTMEDDWELAHNLDITINDSEEDPDSDGLSNIKEYEKGTSPQDNDTDDDGLLDGQEVNIYNTDPLLADTDNGGEKDGSEILTLRNPLDSDDDALSLTIIPTQTKNNTRHLTVYWLASSHGMLNYSIALGTQENIVDIHEWEEIGQSNLFTFEKGLITTGTDYFIQIEAFENGNSKGKFVKKWEAENIQAGDIDGNGVVNLNDAILVLKINSAISISNIIPKTSDVNGDSKQSIADAIFIMKTVAE